MLFTEERYRPDMPRSDEARSLLKHPWFWTYVRIPVHRLCGGYRPGTIRATDLHASFKEGQGRSAKRWVKRREFSLDAK